MNRLVTSFSSAALLIILIMAARILDRKWRAKNPSEMPFAWGYFQALCFFPAGLLWFLVPIVTRHMWWLYWLYVAFYGIAGSIAGYTLITKKRRWAWIFVVVAQINLITWAIDYYYGSKRWNEFR